jgi:hypothetical protein
MKNSVRSIIAVASALAIGSAPVRLDSAAFQAEQIPADVVWYAHLDVERTLASTFGRLATERLSEQERTKIRIFSRMFGFSLLDGLRAVTVFGMPGHPDGGVLILKGKFDRDYLVDLVSVNDNYALFEHGSTTVHYWIDEEKGKDSFGAFANDDTLLLTDSKALIKSALDAIHGRQPGLKARPIGEVAGAISDAALIIGVADFGRMEGLETEAAILKEIESGQLAAAELDANFRVLMSLVAVEEGNALNIQRVADGILAFAALNPEKPGLGRLASAVSIERTGRRVDGIFSFPVDELVDILQSLR